MHVHNRMDMHGSKYFWSTAPKKTQKTTFPVHLHSLVQHTHKHSYCAGKDMHAEKEKIHVALRKKQR